MAGHEPTKRAVNAVADAGCAWALGTELLASLVGGGLIGFAIDYFAGTFPWFMLILGGLGLVGGFIRVVRA
ncbi:MAG: AtpZ/AtpI family protein, partial [Planctomycetota bacterium]